MSKIASFKQTYSRDSKVLSLISQIESAMAPLTTGLIAGTSSAPGK